MLTMAVSGCDSKSDEIVITPPSPLRRVPGDYQSIQAAINAARAGDTVIVADGTYVGAGNRDLDFKGKAIVIRSAGGPGACILEAHGTASAPHRIVFSENAQDSLAVMDGFTLTGGHSSDGGAVWLKSSSPTFVNCVFVGNSATSSGGAVRCKDASPRFQNCTFYDNSSVAGGVVFCIASASPTFERCILAENTDGSAVFCNDVLSRPNFMCTNVFGNVGGDWVGCIEDLQGIDGNLSVDPRFCDPRLGDLSLDSNSPCAPANSPCGELVGAVPVNCNAP